MPNDNWSPFYPTVIYPAQESTSLQRQMSSDLQTIVRDLSRIGQSQPQAQIVQSRDHDASHQMAMSIDDLRESLGRDLGGLRNELGGLSSQLEWSIGLLHESIVEQTDVLLTIAKQQRIPTELKVSEYLTGAQEMMHQLASDIQSNRLDQNQIEQKFTAIDSRFIEAIDPLPRAGLMYAILLARAELYLLVKKDNEALAFLEESLLYAPRDDSFDYGSYSYRLMGRIVFTQGSSLEAEGYLGKAINLSPGYAIAWYDRAQYLASTGADIATLSLRHAIEMNEGFMLLANIEPNFDPIRKEVDELIETIRQEKADDLFKRTEQLRQSYLSIYATQSVKVEQIQSILCNKNFENIERLAAELVTKMDRKRPVVVGYFNERMQNILSLQSRIWACTSLESLEDLSHEIDSFGSTCESLLQLLIQTEKYRKDIIPGWTRSYIGVCIESNTKDEEAVNARRGRPQGTLANLIFGGKWQPDKDSQQKLNTIAWRLAMISDLNKILPEFEAALAASYERVEIDAESDRVVFIKNCYSRLNLDLKDWNEGNGTPLQLWEFAGDLNQQWHIVPVEPYSPDVYIVSVFSGKNIDLADGNMDEGARIQMWESGNSNPNQLWRLVRQDDGSYAIQSTRSNLFLGLSEYDREKGAIVNLQHWSGELSQKWLIYNVQ